MTAPLHVLVTEPVLARFRDVLTEDGAGRHTWTFAEPGAESFDEAAARADVLVGSSAPASLLTAMPRLRLVHVSGAGTDKVAFDALPPGVPVANTFHHGRSIAEHVLMVAMMLRRGIPSSDRGMRDGRWRNVMVDPSVPFGGVLRGGVLGLVGYGEIGRAVADLASRWDMRVRAVRRRPTPEEGPAEWTGTMERLPELLAESDVVVVTVPLNDSTRGMIGARELLAMRSDAVLVNVARGPVVDERALHDALARGAIGGAGLDVWWRDPRAPEAPPPSHLDFTVFENVVLTPHQSGHTVETFTGRALDIRANIDALADGRPLRNVVAPGAPG